MKKTMETVLTHFILHFFQLCYITAQESYLSRNVKLGLSWERFELSLCYWMFVPLKCSLKCAPCNEDKICEKTYFGINSVWPRDRLCGKWRISCQLPKVCGQCIYISYSRRLVDEHLLSGFRCGRKSTLHVSYIAVISYIYLIAQLHVMVLGLWWRAICCGFMHLQ